MSNSPSTQPRQPQIGGFFVALGTPRKLPNANRLVGRVVVLDVAFASQVGGRKSGFERTTLRFIDRLGARLAAWVDHHDSEHHQQFLDDPRFTLASKAEHGACPEMIDKALVESAGAVDTLVCHNDFDGLASAAKWILRGEQPYPGCDDDARAIDTRIGLPGDVGRRCDRALRARPRDVELRFQILRHLVSNARDPALWNVIDEAGDELITREKEAERLALTYESLTPHLQIVDATGAAPYDRTWLLLMGQQQAKMVAAIDGDNVTFAAPFDSGVSFVQRFGLSGGMPTLVTIHRHKLRAALLALDVPEVRIAELGV